MDGDRGPDRDEPSIGGDDPEALEDVLASIRALVSAETASRTGQGTNTGAVLMLTEEMRVDADPELRSGEVLADGIAAAGDRMAPAPILDEEALRGVVNSIVREELQGELGDRISRNLRKLIRRELAQMIDERRSGAD
jgi:hypothetical protein